MLDAVAKWLFRVVAAVFVTACIFGVAKSNLDTLTPHLDSEDQAFQGKVDAPYQRYLAQKGTGCSKPMATREDDESPQRKPVIIAKNRLTSRAGCCRRLSPL